MDLAGIYKTLTHRMHGGVQLKPGASVELTHAEAVEAIAEGTVEDPTKAKVAEAVAKHGMPSLQEVEGLVKRLETLQAEKAQLSDDLRHADESWKASLDEANKLGADFKAVAEDLAQKNAALQSELDAARKATPSKDAPDASPDVTSQVVDVDPAPEQTRKSRKPLPLA